MIRYLISIIIIIIAGCNNYNNSEKYKAFYDAFEQNSTSINFVVFTAVNLNTSESKEICSSSSSLLNAYIYDFNFNKDTTVLKDNEDKAYQSFKTILKSKSKYNSFGFNTSEALNKIGYFNYSMDTLASYLNNYNLSIIDSIKANYNPKKPILLENYFKKVNLYLIHILNRNGIICCSDCETGAIIIKKIIK